MTAREPQEVAQVATDLGTIRDIAGNLSLVLVGNLIGAVLVAYFLAVQTGVIGHAGATGGTAVLTYERLAGIAEDKALAHNGWQT